ncbi:hypothetical protein [Desulfovibrio desulfuricans]|uniref:hypothetical protein n=1 Tax=Desulfovibrio desulfuricans TaxID=876 RepID=UPI0035AE1350
MGSCIPFIDEQPFAERVKTMEEDELLEIWEETQQLESMLCSALHADLALAPDYEKVIVEELFLRSSRRVRQAPLGK